MGKSVLIDSANGRGGYKNYSLTRLFWSNCILLREFKRWDIRFISADKEMLHPPHF